MLIDNSGFIFLIIFTIILIGSCGEIKDITPSQELFYPNPNLKVKGLKGLELKDPKIHSTDCLFQQKGDTSIYFFFDSGRENITGVSWEITLEQNTFKKEINKILDGVYLLCDIGIDDLEVHHLDKHERIWVLNRSNNFVFRCDLIKENQKVKFYVHYDYPESTQ